MKICRKCRHSHHSGKCGSINDSNPLSQWVGSKSSSIVSNCPRCSTLTEKNGGCSQMKCKMCDYKYCWVCGCQTGYENKMHEIFEPLCQFWNSSLTGYDHSIVYRIFGSCFKNIPRTTTFVVMLVCPPIIYIIELIVGIFMAIFGAIKESKRYNNYCQYRIIKLSVWLILYTLSFCFRAAIGFIALVLYYPLFLLWISFIAYRNIKCRKLRGRDTLFKHKSPRTSSRIFNNRRFNNYDSG